MERSRRDEAIGKTKRGFALGPGREGFDKLSLTRTLTKRLQLDGQAEPVEAHLTGVSKNTSILIPFLLFSLLLFSFAPASAQTRRYLVLLKDKASSPYSVSRPQEFLSARAIQRRQRQNIAVQERDLPPNPAYVAQLRQTGATVRYTSRWMNAVLLDASDSVLRSVQALPFVQGLAGGRALAEGRALGGGRVAAPTSNAGQRKRGTVTATSAGRPEPLRSVTDVLNYGASSMQITQLGVDSMHRRNLRGEGVLIGLLDSGFSRANQVPYLQSLFNENRVVATYDFPDRETDVYDDDEHGLNCLSTIAATADGQLYGTAYKASFVLLRTEIVATETPQEEAFWLLGAEFADSAGVDVLGSSLGYTTFDNPADNYTYADLTGNKTLSAQAANWAAAAGMLVVVSAGNEGDGPWQFIGTPADAPSALAVGGVNSQGQRVGFSSIGPTPDGRIKPDVAARASGTVIGAASGTIVTGQGTSFASPLVVGLAAGLWQANPTKTAAQLFDALRRSGSQAANPDNLLGYGIPHFARADEFLKTGTIRTPGVNPPIVNPPVVLGAEPLLATFQLGPNPLIGTSQLWLKGVTATTATLRLTDPLGRALWQQTGPVTSHHNVALPALAPGVYYLTVETENGAKTVRVLKL